MGVDVVKVMEHLKQLIEQNARLDERYKALDGRVGELLPIAKAMSALAHETLGGQKALEGRVADLQKEIVDIRGSLADARERLSSSEAKSESLEDRIVSKLAVLALSGQRESSEPKRTMQLAPGGSPEGVS